MDVKHELPLALRAAYLALHRATDARLVKHDVTADQFVLLKALSESKALTQRELADRISSDPSTVRAMLVLLEENKLVKRDRHPTDSRAKTVSLTSTGKLKLKRLWKAGQPIRDEMYASMTPDEADTLIALLRQMTSALNQERLNEETSLA